MAATRSDLSPAPSPSPALDRLLAAVREQWLLAEAGAGGAARPPSPRTPSDSSSTRPSSTRAASSEADEAERSRLIALVELARDGDKEAFGQLYDHYHPQVYRFLLYRTRSVSLAEDLTSETFFRALRRISGFTWQGRDFGAWLITIARNLATDDAKSARNRLETTTEDMSPHDDATEGPEDAVLDALTHEVLLAALADLPEDQRDCLVLRFLQDLSIAQTAQVLDRSPGAVKQLQLRAVRNLARVLPDWMREQGVDQ